MLTTEIPFFIGSLLLCINDNCTCCTVELASWIRALSGLLHRLPFSVQRPLDCATLVTEVNFIEHLGIDYRVELARMSSRQLTIQAVMNSIS
jgi:hypothetical protein